MNDDSPQLSNPFSTGGGGPHFENQVQSAFVVLMLSGGVAPCLPPWRIVKIKLQGRHKGFKTDDCIVFTEDRTGNHSARLLAQIKHVVSITEGDQKFGEAIRAAWQDYNNPEVFDPASRDAIALITGPLSASDIQNARVLLEWARHSESAEDFLDKVNLGKFSSEEKQAKLHAFQCQLKKANNGVELSDDQLWRFLKSYHLLGFDLDVVSGVTLCLLNSHIGQMAGDNIDALWAMVTKEVSWFNQDAGTLTLETISSAIKTAFSERRQERIPAQFLKRDDGSRLDLEVDYFSGSHSIQLMRASLVGGWHEKVPPDMNIVREIVAATDDEFRAWVDSIRAISLLPNPPLKQRDGQWELTNRKDAWLVVGSRIFDQDLDRLRSIAVNVLRERDPQFELDNQDRFAANIRGKAFAHSPMLREGLSTTLALLGSLPAALTSVTHGKAESIAILAVREILKDADWVLWASLNDQLPLLAEAAPDEFLDAVEGALNQNRSPFREVFSQEGGMPFGQNHLTGLLWALENLAWHPDYLVRVVALLGDLAAIDPGGKWANRPANSLGEILLPWHPQTTASIAKRHAAVSTLHREHPQVGWTLLLTLLPNSHAMASGTHKPAIRDFRPADWPDAASNQDYWAQVSGYADLAIQVAQDEPSKLAELTKRLPDLPESAILSLLSLLTSEKVLGLPETNRGLIWETLTNLALTHQKNANAEWALRAETIAKVNEAAAILAPKTASELSRPLFGDHDYQLYEGNVNFEEEHRKLEDKRLRAVERVLQTEDFSGVLKLARNVKTPFKVGFALGSLDSEAVDSAVLPVLLGVEEKHVRSLVDGFVRARFWGSSWDWVDKTTTLAWTVDETLTFLTLLPIMPETGRRAERLLGKDERLYWERANVNGFIMQDGILEVVDKFLHFGRPRSALLCIERVGLEKIALTPALATRVLSDVATVDEPNVSLDSYAALCLIKWLQDNPEVDVDTLMKIEWAYLPLFNHSLGGSPKTLERRISTDPTFFCEVLGTVFRPEKDRKTKLNLTESEKNMAKSAYTLLREWKSVPGLSPEGSLDMAVFEKWMNEVKKRTTDSGHFDVAMSQIGEVLVYSPPDPDGLWIHRAVADALNARDAAKLRDGFTRELFNRRGAYWNTRGKVELELAASYKKQAEDLDLGGFQRFATAVRELAVNYERDAKREAARDPFDP